MPAQQRPLAPPAAPVDAGLDAAVDAPVAEAEREMDPDEPPRDPVVLQHFPGIDVVESYNGETTWDGGPAIQIETISINLVVRDKRTHDIEIKRAAIVNGVCSEADTKLKVVPVSSVELSTWDAEQPFARGMRRVTTPKAAGQKLNLTVMLLEGATSSTCAFDVVISIDGERRTLELPVRNSVRRPLQRDP